MGFETLPFSLLSICIKRTSLRILDHNFGKQMLCFIWKIKALLFKTFFIVPLVFFNIAVQANSNDIRILGPRDKIDPVYSYFVDLTKLVLSKTQHLYPDSKVVLIPSNRVTQGRSLLLLDKNYLDLVWSGTNTERESRYLPIYFPLFRGLLGYRVLLIRKEDVGKFSQITTSAQLKELVACQGAHWPDSDILEDNGYTVSRVVHFDAMFKMLSRKRCDYFPRAVFEGFSEQKAIVSEFENIVLFDDIILHYNFPFYYFVDKENIELSKRLSTGLKQSLQDGSFMALMKNHSVSKHLFPLSQWKNKRFFELVNGDFDSQTLENNSHFWLNLEARE